MKGISSISYTAAIRACKKGREWQIAMPPLVTMVRQARGWINTISYIAASRACKKGGERQRAMQLLVAMSGKARGELSHRIVLSARWQAAGCGATSATLAADLCSAAFTSGLA